jgi:hypothetical protein
MAYDRRVGHEYCMVPGAAPAGTIGAACEGLVGRIERVYPVPGYQWVSFPFGKGIEICVPDAWLMPARPWQLSAAHA